MRYEAKFRKLKEFIDFYGCFSNRLPRRTQGRSTIHVETCLFSILSPLLIKNRILTFPLTVEYSDKPDFRIYSKSKIIGIEITESSYQNFGHALALSESSNGIMDCGDFRFSEHEGKKTKADIEKLLDKNTITNPPWEGNSAEKEWASRAKSVALSKVKKFCGYPNYQDYSTKILLVFDVHPEPVDFNQMTDDLMAIIIGCEEIASFYQYLIFADNTVVFIDTERKEWEWYHQSQFSACFQE